MTTNKNTECKHEFETITNLYGKIIGEFIEDGIVYRSLIKCKYCGEKRKSTEVNKTCNVKNQPYLW